MGKFSPFLDIPVPPLNPGAQRSGQTDPFSPFRFPGCHSTDNPPNSFSCCRCLLSRKERFLSRQQRNAANLAIPPRILHPLTVCPKLRVVMICAGPARSGRVDHPSAGTVHALIIGPCFLPLCCVVPLPAHGQWPSSCRQRASVAAFPVAAHLKSLSLHDPGHRLSG